MKLLSYLYYKLYSAALLSSLKDIPHFTACVWLSGLIGTNILVIYLFLVKINAVPYLFTSYKQGGWLIALTIIIAIIFFNKTRREAILNSYSDEAKKSRVKGNIITWTYVGISFLSIFAVAFFRKGHL